MSSVDMETLSHSYPGGKTGRPLVDRAREVAEHHRVPSARVLPRTGVKPGGGLDHRLTHVRQLARPLGGTEAVADRRAPRSYAVALAFIVKPLADRESA